MHREYLRAMTRHGKTWFGGLIGLVTTVAGLATIVIAVFAGLGKLPVWSPAPLTFLVTVGALYPVTYRAWREEHEKVIAPEPRDSPQWNKHLEQMQKFTLTVANAVSNHNPLWQEEIRDSLVVHFPEMGQRLDTYQEAFDAVTVAKTEVYHHCLHEAHNVLFPAIGWEYLAHALEAWGTAFADGRDATEEAHDFFRNIEAVQARSLEEQKDFHERLDDFMIAFKRSDAVEHLRIAGDSGRSASISAGNVYHDLKSKVRVPGKRCDLCRELPP